MVSCRSPRQLIQRPPFFEFPVPQIYIQVALLKYRRLFPLWLHSGRLSYTFTTHSPYPQTIQRDVALQLAGEKKVQEVLTRSGVLERFYRCWKYVEHVFGKYNINELRASLWAYGGVMNLIGKGVGLVFTVHNNAVC